MINKELRAPVADERLCTQKSFINELGNRITITIEGPTSTSENILTPMEVAQLRETLNAHISASVAGEARPAMRVFVKDGKASHPTTLGAPLPDGFHDFYAAPQASAENVHNAALEKAARLMEQTGKRIAASDIRALKTQADKDGGQQRGGGAQR